MNEKYVYEEFKSPEKPRKSGTYFSSYGVSKFVMNGEGGRWEGDEPSWFVVNSFSGTGVTMGWTRKRFESYGMKFPVENLRR